jgi:hypothetical protein
VPRSDAAGPGGHRRRAGVGAPPRRLWRWRACLALRARQALRAGVLDGPFAHLKRDAAVGGKATFRFTIGSCGELSSVEIAGRRGKVDEAAACVAGAMRAWRTPFRPAEPVTVEYPIAFSSSM